MLNVNFSLKDLKSSLCVFSRFYSSSEFCTSLKYHIGSLKCFFIFLIHSFIHTLFLQVLRQ